MHRHRPSVPPQGSSFVSSSSEASLHTAHESRRSMYPGLQARASDAGEYDLQRSSRSGLSGLLKSVREDEECELPGRPPRSLSERTLQTTESNSRYSGSGSSVRWSISSHASFSDLDPHDSISNQDSSSNGGSSFTGNSRIPHSLTSSRFCTAHGCYRDDEDYDPRSGAWSKVAVRKERRYPPEYFNANLSVHQGQGQHNGDRIDPRDVLAFYSEEPGTSRSHYGSGMDTPLDTYDDDYEDPFAPRDHNDSERKSRRDYRGYMEFPHDAHDFTK